jgi:hypothetical protein
MALSKSAHKTWSNRKADLHRKLASGGPTQRADKRRNLTGAEVASRKVVDASSGTTRPITDLEHSQQKLLVTRCWSQLELAALQAKLDEMNRVEALPPTERAAYISQNLSVQVEEVADKIDSNHGEVMDMLGGIRTLLDNGIGKSAAAQASSADAAAPELSDGQRLEHHLLPHVPLELRPALMRHLVSSRLELVGPTLEPIEIGNASLSLLQHFAHKMQVQGPTRFAELATARINLQNGFAETAENRGLWKHFEFQKWATEQTVQDVRHMRQCIDAVGGNYSLVEVRNAKNGMTTTAVVQTARCFHDFKDGRLERSVGHRVFNLESEQFTWVRQDELTFVCRLDPALPAEPSNWNLPDDVTFDASSGTNYTTNARMAELLEWSSDKSTKSQRPKLENGLLKCLVERLKQHSIATASTIEVAPSPETTVSATETSAPEVPGLLLS